MQTQHKRTAMCTQINTNKYIEHQPNNNKHDEKTCLRMHVYNRSQKRSLEGENEDPPSRECSSDEMCYTIKRQDEAINEQK